MVEDFIMYYATIINMVGEPPRFGLDLFESPEDARSVLLDAIAHHAEGILQEFGGENTMLEMIAVAVEELKCHDVAKLGYHVYLPTGGGYPPTSFQILAGDDAPARVERLRRESEAYFGRDY
jgi:hypothetical protein